MKKSNLISISLSIIGVFVLAQEAQADLISPGSAIATGIIFLGLIVGFIAVVAFVAIWVIRGIRKRKKNVINK